MDKYAGQRVLMIEVPGRRERVRPQRIFLDLVKDSQGVGVTEEDVGENDLLWRPLKGQEGKRGKRYIY